MTEPNSVRVAIEGCGHGTLNAIYASVKQSCEIRGWDGVDLLIIGGDFQAVRNSHDLNCMSVPIKYREIGDFHEYYSGRRTAPYLTIFIGGNHEASNHLWELYYGGWVAPNIYYMGAANVVRLGPLRIAGLSGIWKGYNYNKAHHERIPFSQDDTKSAYHVREWDTRKLLQVKTQVDVGLSHDWPRAVEHDGDKRALFRKKPDFERDSRDGQLGSVAARKVLDRLKPPYWFSAHLHVKFAAIVRHRTSKDESVQVASSTNIQPPAAATTKNTAKNEEEIDLDVDDVEYVKDVPKNNGEEIELDIDVDDTSSLPMPTTTAGTTTNTDEIDLDMDDEAPAQPSTATAQSAVPQDLRDQLPAAFAKPEPRAPRSHESRDTQQLPTPLITNDETKFLSLDKCLPNRHFLQLVEIPSSGTAGLERPLRLAYDQEWLAITRVFANELPNGDPTRTIPVDKGEAQYAPLIEAEQTWVEENIISKGKMTIPEDFEITAPTYEPSIGLNPKDQNLIYKNPHTERFCSLLQIPNAFQPTTDELEKWAGETVVASPAEHDGYSGGRGGRGGWRGGHGHGHRGGGRGGGRGGRSHRGGGRGGGGGGGERGRGYPY